MRIVIRLVRTLACTCRGFVASMLLLIAAPAALSAQGTSVTGAIQASIDIVYPPLSGTGVRPLDFGILIPGAPAVAVAPMTTRSGEFRVAGTQFRKSVNISFTLPTVLLGPAAAAIPLNFNGNYAGLCEIDTTGTCVLASFTSWNPVTTPLFIDTPARYKPGRKAYAYDQYSVYLGGLATPSATQKAGRYTATIGVLLVIN